MVVTLYTFGIFSESGLRTLRITAILIKNMFVIAFQAIGRRSAIRTKFFAFLAIFIAFLEVSWMIITR